MTQEEYTVALNEFVQDLQTQGLDPKEMTAKAAEFRNANKPTEEVKEKGIVETDASAVPKKNQASSGEYTLEDGSLDFQPQGLSNKQGFGSAQFMSDAMNNVTTDILGNRSIETKVTNKDILKKFKIGSDDRTKAYFQLNLKPDDTINKELFETIKNQDNRTKEEVVEDLNEGDIYNTGLPSIDFDKIGKSLGYETKEYEAAKLSIENLDRVSEYIENIKKEKEISPEKFTKISQNPLLDDTMSVLSKVIGSADNIALGWENAYEASKGMGVDFLSPVLEKVIEEDTLDEYILNQFEKSVNLTSKRNNIGSLIKKFDISDVKSTELTDGVEFIGGVINALSSLGETIVPAMLTGGYSLLPQIAAPMYIDYNITKAETLYGNSENPLKTLREKNETEILIPAGLGALSMGLEYIGLKGIGKFIAGKTGALGPLVAMGLTQNKEGLTELAQVGVESFNNSIAKGISFREATAISFDKMSSKEGIESYAMGFVASGGITAPSAFSKMMVTEGENRGNVQKYINALGRLQVQRNSNNDPAFRKSMDIKIESVETSFKDFINNSYNLSKVLNKEQQAKILGFIDKKSTNNKTLKDLTSSYKKGKMSGQQYGSAKGALVNNNKALNNKIIKVQTEANLEIIEKDIVDVTAEVGEENIEVYNTKKEFTEATGKPEDVDAAFVEKDGKILINKEKAAEVGAITASSHELVHKVTASSFNDPVAGAKLVKQFKDTLNKKELKIVQKRIDDNYRYKRDSNGRIQLDENGEAIENDPISYQKEWFTSFSDAIGKKEIGYNDNLGESLLKFAKDYLIPNIFKPKGLVNADFTSGRDVYNWIKDYNKNIKSGKGLDTRGQALIKQPIVDSDNVSMSKTSQKLPEDTQTYMELDNDVLQQGLVSEIQNEGSNRFTIAQAITEKNWPLISKNLDINNEAQMLAAKEIAQEQLLGIFPGSGKGKYTARKTSALSGFSLDPNEGSAAAQVSTYLAETMRRRKPEIDIAIKERTGSSVELDTNKSDKVADVNVVETLKPKAKRSPKKDKTYSRVLQDNLGEDVAKAIDTAIEIDLENMNVGDRFGNTKNIGPKLGEVLSKIFKLDSRVFTDKSWNIKKGDLKGLTNLKQYLNSNAINDFKLLPDAYNDKGKSNFIPDNILNKLYVKDGKGKWKLDPTKTVADYKALLGPIEGAVYRASEATTIKGLAGLSFRNMIFETAVPNAIDRMSTGVQFSKTVQNFIDDRLFDLDTKGAEGVLQKYIGKGIHDINSEKGIDEYFDDLKRIVLPMFPKGFISKTMLRPSNRIFSKNGKKSITVDGKETTIDEYYTKKRNELLSDPKQVYGKPFTGAAKGFKQRVYENWLGNTPAELEKSNKNGRIKEFNAQNASMHKQMWSRINESIKKDKNNARAIANLLKMVGNLKTHPHRLGAELVGWSPNPKGDKGRLYEWEHAMPATASYLYLLDSALGENVDFNSAYRLVMDNYKLIALDKAQNSKLGTAGLGTKMPKGWNVLNNSWIERYFNSEVAKVNGGIDPSSIIGLDGRSFADIFKIKSNGETTTESLIKEAKTAVTFNDDTFGDKVSFSKTTQGQIETLAELDKRAAQERKDNLTTKQKTFDTIFNDIIESSTGIESFKEYSSARATTVGAKKGRFSFLTTPSAEDFVGLLYKTLGKGKVGDAQFKFYKDNLIDPYNRAELAVTKAKMTTANDFKALKRNLKTLPKSLSKPTGIGGFTFGQAARVAVWTRQGMEVPGMSKRDIKELNDFVDNNKEMSIFADELINIQKGKPYPAPTKTWLGGNITSDILNEINKVNRKEYLQEWQENIDAIFSEKNMNKLEAAYGPRYVEALRDQIARMKSGSNRPIGGSRVVNQLLDWLNNSVGAVMFLNTRSAVLQTLSAVNFINFGNNNIYKAGKAFANQPQFWKDFKTLMNSDYLVERRNGLKINVSESEIADAVAESSNKPKAAISYLLNKGFIFTRIADSFAIAVGGASFYRNTIDAYVEQGMDVKAAEKQAFDDFYAIAEESQQSSNPSKISQQQASAAGRVVLAFANTPMQYNRIIKRASQDLINKRGDWRSNVSKIVYYAAVQNLIFNALQNALFAEAFGEDEDEDEKQANKEGRIANGMADSLLRGLGIQGAVVSALKNSLMTIANENNKKSPKFVKAVYDLFDFSPPLDSKFRKLRSGANTITWEKENIKEKGFDLNNPAYLAGAQVVSGLTNLPLDRAIQKINNIRAIASNSSENWQKVAMALGWSTWDVGLPFYGVDDKVVMTPQMILKEKVTTMAKETSTKEQKQMLLDLGLTKQEIKALKYEDVRVKKIIELQKKK